MADNASCGLFVLGDKAVSPHKVDLVTCGMVHEKNGEVIATGAGAAALGSPVNCVTWLANTLGEFGIKLEAGEVILSGSLVPLHPIVPGDSMHLSVGGIGTAARKLEMDTVDFLMMAHMNEPDGLLKQAKLMESYGANCIYCTDSAGYMLPDDVTARIATLREHLKPETEIGFHGHHNMAMGVANSLAAIEAGADRIDGS